MGGVLNELEKGLSKEEIAQSEIRVQRELEALASLQQGVSDALKKHMERNGIGFNEAARQMGITPAMMSKILKGGNLTFNTIVKVSTLMKKKPSIFWSEDAR